MTDMISFVTNTQAQGGKAATAQATLADNFDTFLTILTAQIQNQDPLEPMDSNQFTEQLVQFSGVEQQIRVNSQLETLIKATNANAGASLSGYLGQQAEINTSAAQFRGEPVNWRYALPAEAAKVRITVTGQDGKILYSQDGSTAAGSHDFIWDGTLNSGQKATPGEAYRINVVAEDAAKKAITPLHSLVTTITGVDLTYGEPALTTPSGIFGYADIRRLMRN